MIPKCAKNSNLRPTINTLHKESIKSPRPNNGNDRRVSTSLYKHLKYYTLRNDYRTLIILPTQLL